MLSRSGVVDRAPRGSLRRFLRQMPAPLAEVAVATAGMVGQAVTVVRDADG